MKYVFTITVICLILDYLDGYIARKLNVKSDIGIQLDSLADMVSFGLVPGILLYNMFNAAPSSSIGSISSSFIPFLGFIITLFSAYRLARYNISAEGNSFSEIILDYNVLMLIVIVSSILLVSDIKLLNFKFKSLKFKGNRRRFLIIFFSIPALIIFGIYAIPLVLSVYIITSIFTFYKLKN